VKLFVSYTSADRGWAHWIGWQLKAAGHEAFLHEWEIGAGQNIPRWMEERIDQADHLIGVFSDKYSEAIFSRSERWAAYWDDPEGRVGFLIPVEVVKVTKWPRLVSPLNRLSLTGMSEPAAVERLRTFLEPPKPPTEKPAYPGSTSELSNTAFTQDSEPLGVKPPNFPAAATIETKPVDAGTPYPSLAIEPSLSIRCIDDHEPKPQIFGRDDEVETIVNALLENKTVLVAGGPGMGKTAVATVALYDPRIVARFGRRRVFASLETATEPRAILAKLVEMLGLPPTGDEATLIQILEASAAARPFAAILDNAETVFDADRGASQRTLSLLAQIESLSLVVTIRGVAPPIAGAIQIGDLSKLDPSATRDAFLAVAGDSLRSDLDLSYLLEAFDGHALSTRLIAAQAVGSTSLSGFRESWDEAHAQILRISGEEESRLTSVRASLALSLNSKRLKSNPLARRLISLLAFLPGGLAEADVRSLLGDRGALTQVKAHEAVICLRQLLLVESRPDRRLRMLTPLRECIKTEGLILEPDKERLIDRYLKLTAKAEDINRKQWEEHRANVVAEADNLDVVCELAVATNLNNRLLPNALFGLANFYNYSGYGTTVSIEHAAARLGRGQPSILAANCIFNLGEIAKSRSDYKTARVRFNEALLVYKRLGQIGGEANCVQRLGDIAFAHSDLKTARLNFEEALNLYQKISDVGSQAHSIRNLAEIAVKESRYELARTRLDEALVLHQRVGDLVGEANYKHLLGIIARAHSNFEEARILLDEGLLLTRRIGIVINEANCIQEIAHTERARGNDSNALTHYELALKLYRRANAFRGEAESIIRIGQIKRKDAPAGKEGLVNIKAGFDLFFKMVDAEDMALPGWMATHRSLLSGDQTEAQTYQSQARASWLAIGRLDLIRDWIDLT
jgi:tetratricopeptide (TPR) repeat protein